MTASRYVRPSTLHLRPSWPQRFVRRLASALVMLPFFAALLALLLELDWLENTLAVHTLVLGCIAVGGILFLLLHWLGRPMLGYFNDEAWAVSILLAVSVVAGSVFVGSYVNRYFHRGVLSAEYRILDKEHEKASSRTPPAWYLLLETDQRVERVLVSQGEWGNAAIGELHRTRIGHGALGYDFILCPARPCSAAREWAVNLTRSQSRDLGCGTFAQQCGLKR